MAKFKKMAINHYFIPLKYDGEIQDFKKKNGKRVEFKTQSAAEKFCIENRCDYMEQIYHMHRLVKVDK